MNNNKRLMTLVSSCLIAFALVAETNPSFLQKVASIKNDLYKLSPQELCAALTISVPQTPVITADQLKQEMSSNATILVINVLPEKYYKDCHITGSINAPLKDLVDRAQSWNRSQRIVVYCALDECDAGEKGSILLGCMGFTNVVDYKGGIKEWYQLNYPTQGPALSEYLHEKSVHKGYECYPATVVCSNQIRWINRYQN